MPITNGIWTNYTFSNCQYSIVNGTIHYVNVSLSQLNTSGFLCSIATNLPYFWAILFMTIYVVVLLLYAWLQSFRLVVISTAVMFVFATILLTYGILFPSIWLMSLIALIISVALYYFSHRF